MNVALRFFLQYLTFRRNQEKSARSLYSSHGFLANLTTARDLLNLAGGIKSALVEISRGLTLSQGFLRLSFSLLEERSWDQLIRGHFGLPRIASFDLDQEMAPH